MNPDIDCALLSALLIVGCGSGEPVETVRPAPVARLPPAAPAVDVDERVDLVEGVVRLAPDAVLPRWDESALGSGPRMPRCGALSEADVSPVSMSTGRALGGVLVALTGFEGEIERPTATHEVRVDGCVITPSFVAATLHDRLVLRNVGPEPVSLRSSLWRDEGLVLEPGDRHALSADQAGVSSISCAPDASCGRVDVTVLHHPLHAITDGYGRYRFENVPPGSIQVNAWHPLFEESDAQVDVPARVELTLRPRLP